MTDIKYYFKDRYESKSTQVRVFYTGLAIFFIWIIRGLGKSIAQEPMMQDFGFIVWACYAMIIGTMIFFFLSKNQVSGIIEQYGIHSIKDRLENKGRLSGGFILGCGTITGKQYQQDYYVFFKKGSFGLIKDKIQADDAEIIMTNEISPSYKKVNVGGEEKEFLFVPKNTIKKTIKIEL